MWMKFPDIREGAKDVAQWSPTRRQRSLPVTCERVGTERREAGEGRVMEVRRGE